MGSAATSSWELWPRRLPLWMTSRGINAIHIRVGIHLGGTIFLTLAALSTPSIWMALSVSAEFFNPMLVMVYAHVMLVSCFSTRRPIAVHCAAYVAAGLLGGSLAMAVSALSFATTPPPHDPFHPWRIPVLLCLGALISAAGQLYRVRSPASAATGQQFQGVFCVTMAGTYPYVLHELPTFAIHYVGFLAIAALAGALVSSFCVPTPCGLRARLGLGAALHAQSKLLADVTGLWLAAPGPDGRLAILRGELDPERRLLDRGVALVVGPMHSAAVAAGLQTLPAAEVLALSAVREVDVYRSAPVFPYAAFDALRVVARSTISAITVLLYAVQSGDLHLRLCYLQRSKLGNILRAARESLDALGRSVRLNEPLSRGLGALECLVARAHGAAETLRTLPPEVAASSDALALHMFVSAYVTIVDRVRLLYCIAPAVLGADQPDAFELATRCVRGLTMPTLGGLHAAEEAGLERRAGAEGPGDKAFAGDGKASIGDGKAFIGDGKAFRENDSLSSTVGRDLEALPGQSLDPVLSVHALSAQDLSVSPRATRASLRMGDVVHRSLVALMDARVKGVGRRPEALFRSATELEQGPSDSGNLQTAFSAHPASASPPTVLDASQSTSFYPSQPTVPGLPQPTVPHLPQPTVPHLPQPTVPTRPLHSHPPLPSPMASTQAPPKPLTLATAQRSSGSTELPGSPGGQDEVLGRLLEDVAGPLPLSPQQVAEIRTCLERPDVLPPPPVLETRPVLGRARAVQDWLLRVWGVQPFHLRIALQSAMTFLTIMGLVCWPAVYQALQHHLTWAMLSSTSIAEATQGRTLQKGLHLLLGSLMGGVLGLATLYTTYLINGLSYANSVQKCVVMIVLLSVLSTISGAVAVWRAPHALVYAMLGVCMCASALSGYASDQAQWEYPLWRTSLSMVGIVVHYFWASALFPVRARDVFEARMGLALKALGGLVRKSLVDLLDGTSAGGDAETDADGAPDEEEDGESKRPARTQSLDSCSLPSKCDTKRAQAGLATQPAAAPSEGAALSLRGEAVLVLRSALYPEPDTPEYRAALARQDRRGCLELPLFVRGGFEVDQATEQTSDDARPTPAAPSPLPPPCLCRNPPLLRALMWQAWHESGLALPGYGSAPLGPAFAAQVELRRSVTRLLKSLAPLMLPMQFEVSVFRRPRRVSPASAAGLVRGLFHVANTLSAFASAMDARGSRRLDVLRPHRLELEALAEQLEATLDTLHALLARSVAVDAAVASLHALTRHADHFVLTLLLGLYPMHTDSYEAVQAVALAALVRSTCRSVWRISCDLLDAFWGRESGPARELTDALGVPAAWSMADQIDFAAHGAVWLSPEPEDELPLPEDGVRAGAHAWERSFSTSRVHTMWNLLPEEDEGSEEEDDSGDLDKETAKGSG